MLLTLVAVLGGTALMGVFYSSFEPTQKFGSIPFFGLWFMVFYGMGFSFIAFYFKSLNTKEKAIQSFLLPHSDLENYLAGYFITMVVYILGISVIAYVSYYVSNHLCAWWLDIPLEVKSFSDIINSDTWRHDIISRIKGYIGLHAIFMFGAIYFKSKNFIKTAVSLIVMIGVFVLYQTVFTGTPLIDYYKSSCNVIRESTYWGAPAELDVFIMDYIQPKFRFLFHFVTPVFFTVLGYVRLKERGV